MWLHKAVLKIRKKGTDPQKNGGRIENIKAEAVIQKLDGTRSIPKVKSSNSEFYEMNVQYNPESLSYSMQAGMVTYEGVDKSTQQKPLPAPESSLDVELIFDVSQAGENASVRNQVEGLVALMMHEETRQIIFCWGNLVYAGELKNVSVQYTMFHPLGHPIRAKVSLSLGRTHPNAGTEMLKAEKEHWRDVMQKFEKEGERADEVGIADMRKKAEEMLKKGQEKGMAGYKYEDLKEGYNNFENPVAVVKINGKDFADNKGSLVLNDLEVELTCGFEASIASFCLYNTFNRTTSVYRFDEFKQYVQLGAKTEIAFGYLGQARIVFAGVITGVSFRMDLGGIPYVMVTAMDVKGLMMSSSFAKQLQAKSYSDAVKEIFKRVAYSKLKQEDLLKLEIDETPDANEEKDNKSRTIEMVNESDYEFVVKAAKRYNYEFFADSTAIYFRKAKKNKETLITLGPTRGILYFDIGYDITGLVEELEARGMDPGKGTLLTAKKKISNKISTGKYAKALLGGSAKVCIDPAITSKQEAQYRVDSMAEQMTYQFGSLECTCLGIPELVPGRFVEIEKLGEPADNVFYIQTVRHVFDKYNGYRTTLIGQTGGLNFSPDR